MSTADYDVGVEKTAADESPIHDSATLSMIFGILSFVILPFIGAGLAIGMGLHALARIRESGGHRGGETRARIGITLGTLNFALCFLALIFVLISVGFYKSRLPMQAPAAPRVIEQGEVAHARSYSPVAVSPVTAGVKMANEIGRNDYDLIEKLQLASKDDPVVCIYTARGDSDNPEMAVLTTKQISYIKDSRITPLKLSEIATILDHRKYMEKYQPQPNGYNFHDQFNVEIIGKDGSRMRVVIRPGVDGPSFFEALNDTWKAAGGGETHTP